MEVYKIIILALVFAVVIVYLKSVNQEIAMLLTIVAGCVLLTVSVDMIAEVFSLYERIATLSGISDNVLKIVVKITLICYVVEFSASLIEDFGLKSLADKLTLVGRIVIAVMAVPVVTSLVSVIENLVS